MIELREKIIEIANDIKWIKSDAIKRNTTFEKHIIDSDKFRHAVTRNTTWRHAYKLAFIIVFGILSFIAYNIIAR